MKLRMLYVLVLLAGVLPAAAHAANDPRQVVQQFSDRLLDVMKNAKALGFQGRAEKLTPAVEQAYDMREMTKSAVGPSAGRLTPEQLDRLSQAFEKFTVANYADQFDGWSGERFEVDQPRTSGESVVVPSKIFPGSGEPTAIDYVMHKDGNGDWKIVDVLLDGTISQVAVRRSEFSSIVRREGPAGLADVLDRKSEAMASKAG
jgi:phospholipid transport system substrate-binding protein